jgi:hypothetical protein
MLTSDEKLLVWKLRLACQAARDHIANQYLYPGGVRERLCNQLSSALSESGELDFKPGVAVLIEKKEPQNS